METIWTTKLAAWLHDPAEKALVLLRDKTGHEWGTVAELRQLIFGSRNIPEAAKTTLKLADWFASAADRPQWPRDEKEGRYAAWSQINFAKNPQLIHPLTGKKTDLGNIEEITSDQAD